MVLFDFWQLKM